MSRFVPRVSNSISRLCTKRNQHKDTFQPRKYNKIGKTAAIPAQNKHFTPIPPSSQCPGDTLSVAVAWERRRDACNKRV